MTHITTALRRRMGDSWFWEGVTFGYSSGLITMLFFILLG